MASLFPLDSVALTKALLAIDSRNPDLVAGAPGESACAQFLAHVLNEWGFAVSLEEVSPGRPNLVARIGPTGRSPLVLNGHLDVVGTEGMTVKPFAAERRGNRLYGRGASDMKAGVAAMCVAAARAAARGSLSSEILVTAVCDEEYASIGTRALLASGLKAAGAIITEPTRLDVCIAHKGFAWAELRFQGVAAHGSRYDVGVDANRHAALFVEALDRFERDTLAQRTHPLLGRASLHAARIEGGTGWSTYAEHCMLRIERRTLPGETAALVMTELDAIRQRLAAGRPNFAVDIELVCAQEPLSLDAQSPLAMAVMSARQTVGGTADLAGASFDAAVFSGLPCWTDAALFAQAGIPALCFGPGDIARAHSADEWIDCAEIERATDVLEAVCAGWGR